MEEVNVSSSKGFEQVYDAMNNTAVTANPTVLIILTVIIIFYYIVFSYLGYSTTNTVAQQSAGMNFVEIIMWGLLIFLVLINGIQYLFQVDVKTAVKNIFSPKTHIPVYGLDILNEKHVDKIVVFSFGYYTEIVEELCSKYSYKPEQFISILDIMS